MVGHLEDVGPQIPGAAVGELVLGQALDVAGEEGAPAVDRGQEHQGALVGGLGAVRLRVEHGEPPAAEGEPLSSRQEAVARSRHGEQPAGAARGLPAGRGPDLVAPGDRRKCPPGRRNGRDRGASLRGQSDDGLPRPAELAGARGRRGRRCPSRRRPPGSRGRRRAAGWSPPDRRRASPARGRAGSRWRLQARAAATAQAAERRRTIRSLAGSRSARPRPAASSQAPQTGTAAGSGSQTSGGVRDGQENGVASRSSTGSSAAARDGETRAAPVQSREAASASPVHGTAGRLSSGARGERR